MKRYDLRIRETKDYSEDDDVDSELETTFLEASVEQPEGEGEPNEDELDKLLDEIQRRVDAKYAEMAEREEKDPSRWQSLLLSLPYYDGSPGKDIDDYFRMLENVAKAGDGRMRIK